MRDDRRRRRESPEGMAMSVEPIGDADRPELPLVSREELEALHEEVSRLPERYRVPGRALRAGGADVSGGGAPTALPGRHDRRAAEAGPGTAPRAADPTGPGPHGRPARRTLRRGSGVGVDAVGAGRCHRPRPRRGSRRARPPRTGWSRPGSSP